MHEYIIKIMRKGAFKHQTISTDQSSLLSVCQILESTDDVSIYSVVEMDFKTFEMKDRHLPDSEAFPKWKSIIEFRPISRS